MTSSFLWSTFAASSLLIGGLLTFWFRIGNKMLGLIMAFGSGVLISAVAFELAHESVELSTGSGMAVLGLFAGAIVFFIGDWFIGHMGGHSPEGLSRLVGSYCPACWVSGSTVLVVIRVKPTCFAMATVTIRSR